MSTVNSTFKKSDNLLSVTLYDSAFLKEGEYVGKVTRNTVSLENLIADILEDHSGLDPFVIQHSAILLQQQMLKMLQQGKGVNVLDLGIMYIGLNGTVKSNTPDAADIPELVVRFTPSAISNKALENVVIDKIVFANNMPEIDSITDLWTNTENAGLTPGKTCRIEGDKLKLGGDDFGLEFVQVDEAGEELPDVLPVKVEIGKVSKNNKKVLEFFIPENLEASGKYKIRIKTSYTGPNSSRKTAVTADSEIITVNGTSEVKTDPVV